MIDLHTHSLKSDGSFTPKDLITRAAELGLKAIALTDHDTVDGLDDALAAASSFGIAFVPGVELEIEYQGGEFHMLGLGLKKWHGDFYDRLVELKRIRLERNLKILDKIKNAGIPADLAEIEEIAGEDVIARPHFAKLLVRKGAAYSLQDAFNKYLDVGKPFYESKKNITEDEAISLIRKAGGYPVIAHPFSLKLSWEDMEKKFKELKSLGLSGIEAYYAAYSMKNCRRLGKLARKLGLVCSAGSDFHGTFMDNRELGQLTAGKKIPDKFLNPFH